jgi:hypothetical protein
VVPHAGNQHPRWESASIVRGAPGIIATCDAVLESAVLKAASMEPHFHAVFVERHKDRVPALLAKTDAGGVARLLVLHKLLR